jgi:anaerobic magnesium-protoporphyrin IX monomethyl ester cyclase
MAQVIIINPPNTDSDTYIARSADRWPHRVRRGKWKILRQKMYPKYPLYLMYGAATVLKAGYSVKVIDAAERDYSVAVTLSQMLEGESPSLVVVEISSPSLKQDLEFLRNVKRAFPNTHVTSVGPHATVFHESLLEKNDFIDSVCREDFYETLPELTRALLEHQSLSQIAGLSFRDGGKIVVNPSRPMIQDLDSLPWPARELLDPRRYIMGHYTYKPQLLMMTSMGCPAKCIFCIWPQITYKGKVKMRRPEAVAEEMLYLKQEYGAREIYFDDDTFNLTEARVMALCEEMIRQKTKLAWITEMRVDRLNLDVLKTMKRAGCVKILYGVESGDQTVLDNTLKKVTLEEIRNTFRLTQKAGIKIHATFMFGLPGETKESIRSTMKFAKELNPDTLQASIAQPYPGTAFYEIAKRNGSLKVDDWEDFDGELRGAIEYPDLSKSEIQAAVGQMYKQFYMRPSNLLERTLKIRSWSDISRLADFAVGYVRRFA